MTTLQQLQESVRRYREPEKYLDIDRLMVDALRIADALTDPTPLSRETLEGIGFEVFHGETGDSFAYSVEKYRVVAWQSRGGEWIFNYVVSGDGEGWLVARPQPTTTGQLLALLMGLEKQ